MSPTRFFSFGGGSTHLLVKDTEGQTKPQEAGLRGLSKDQAIRGTLRLGSRTVLQGEGQSVMRKVSARGFVAVGGPGQACPRAGSACASPRCADTHVCFFLLLDLGG